MTFKFAKSSHSVTPPQNSCISKMDSATDVMMKKKDVKLYEEDKKLGERSPRAKTGDQGLRAENKYPNYNSIL